MIRAVRCDKESFRDVEFTEGLNVILAERADTSGAKDSRNGLGKSTLIEIIHFCLGGSARKVGGIFSTKVLGWTYTLEMTIQGEPVTVSRKTDEPNTVRVVSLFDYSTGSLAEQEVEALQAPTSQGLEPSGQTGSLFVVDYAAAFLDQTDEAFDQAAVFLDLDPEVSADEIPADEKPAGVSLPVESWREFLGKALFDLLPDTTRHYTPTFRSLISYFVRSGKDAYTTAFEHHRKQVEWDKQVNNAFLLGLSWEDASDLQEKKEERVDLDARTRLLAAQLKGNPKRMLGQLEANRIQLQQKLSQEEDELRRFRVHPQYRDINVSVDQLTEQIHELVNANVADSQLADLYKSSRGEEDADIEQLVRMYRDVGVVFPATVQRRLEDVQAFHQQVIQNRKSFLASEIERLDRQIVARTQEVEEKGERRALRMEILETHGALGEYTRLQRLFLEAQGNLNILETQIREIRSLEQRRSQVKIELEQLQLRMRDDYESRAAQRRQAIEIFNSNSEMIYDVQGTLIINVSETGFRFDVEIKRDGSEGIGNMKVFCYDLMLGELWSGKPTSPAFVIHDSIIFDGVDERQVKNALELAAHTSREQKFQYICALNSDNVPWKEFSPDFDFQKYVRLTLTDDTEQGGLLGIRF